MANNTSPPGNRLEPPDVATRAVVLVACGIVVFVGVSLASLKAYYQMQVTPAVHIPPAAFPEPRLQTDDAGDRAQLEQTQRRRLEGYAWVDRDQGIIRIPIREAINHILARGEDAYSPLESIPTAQQPGQGGAR